MGGLLGGGSSSQTQYIPYNAGGSGTGGTVYTPQGQGTADQQYQSLISNFLNQYQSGQTPAQTNYPLIESLVSGLYNSSGYANALNAAGQYGPELQGIGQQAAQQASSFSNLPQQIEQLGTTTTQGIYPLQAGAQSLLQAGQDPQLALYQQLAQQTQQNAAANAASAGLGSSPYAAGLANEAMKNFGIGWENQQLQRQKEALAGASSAYGQAGKLGLDAAQLYGAAPNLANALLNLGSSGVSTAQQGAALPLTTQENFYNQLSNLIGNATSVGTSQYALPQQILNDLQSYLNLGQSASSISGALGNLGYNQGQQNLQNLGSLLGFGNSLFGGSSGSNSGGLFGSSGGLFGSSGLLGGLFGSGGSAATASDIAGTGGTFATDTAGNIIGTDFISALLG